MNSRLPALLLAARGAAAMSAQTAPDSAPAALMTQDSANVFRRFAVDRDKDLAFYREVIDLQPLNGLNMPGGGQMSLFHIGSSQFKFTTAGNRAEKSGPVLDVTGLRVFTYFYADEAAVSTAFTSHGYAAPDFQGPAAVSDVEKSRAFYRQFVGLDELPAVDSTFGKAYRFKLGNASSNILNDDVDAVDARAKAADVKITQPLGMFGQGLKTDQRLRADPSALMESL